MSACCFVPCSLWRILCGDSCDIWNNLTSPWQEQLADLRHINGLPNVRRLQEIIEENADAGTQTIIELNSHELSQCSDHAFLIIVSLCAMPGDGACCDSDYDACVAISDVSIFRSDMTPTLSPRPMLVSEPPLRDQHCLVITECSLSLPRLQRWGKNV